MSNLRAAFLKTIALPIADRALQTNVTSSYRLIRQLHSKSADEIRRWQDMRLKRLVEHAYFHTVYYRSLFREAGLSPEHIATVEDLIRIPALSKEIIRQHREDLRPANLSNIAYKSSATGGSTGNPLVYFLDNSSWSMSTANTILNWERVGYRYGDRYVALGSTSLFVNKKMSFKHWAYYRMKQKIGLNGVNLSDEICSSYIALIRKGNIHYLYGYASAIYLLAKYALEHNVSLDIWACFPTSEVLTDSFRRTIRDAFHCPVMNCYGANDGGITAFALNEDPFEVGYNCYVRLDHPDEEGFGSVLATDLNNYAMPLINYRVGDQAQIGMTFGSSSSYNGQVILRVLGRTSEIFFLANGRKLTGPGFTVLFKDIPVEYYCIEKMAPNALVCWIIKRLGFRPDHERLIVETLKKQAGEGIQIDVRETAKPFLGKSGKRIYFIDREYFQG